MGSKAEVALGLRCMSMTDDSTSFKHAAERPACFGLH